MRKLFIIGLLFVLSGSFVYSNEMTEDYFDIATNYCIEGNYSEALSYLDKILLIEPNNKTVLDLKNGLQQIIKGKNFSFIIPKSNAVKQSIEMKKIGNKQGELTSLTSGNDYWAYYFLGQFYKQNKDYNQAISYLIKSVNAKPSFNQCYLEIAVCYFELGNFQQAVTYLNQYLKVNQQDDFAYALRARAYANLNNNDSALSDILTAIALENSLDYRLLEGKILYNMKRYSQAKEKLEKLTDEVQTAEVYKYLGFCNAELGNYNEAIDSLDKSIILFDDDKLVNTKYNEIKSRIEK